MAMVWGKSWRKLKENAKCWFFNILKDQYDHFQIKNLSKCPSLVHFEEMEYWGLGILLTDKFEYWGCSWQISLSTGNTLRLLLFFGQIWVLALIFNTLIDHTACTCIYCWHIFCGSQIKRSVGTINRWVCLRPIFSQGRGRNQSRARRVRKHSRQGIRVEVNN